MANKFQKSVRERMEHEAMMQIDFATEAPVEPVLEPPPQAVTRGIPVKEMSGGVGLYLRRDTERTAKNKTFYLDVAVIEALRCAAKSQGVTDSKLCNGILRRVLSLD